MPIGGTAFFGQNQHLRITTNYLNQLNRRGDPGAGVNVSTAQISGSIVQEYLGFAGGKLTITNPWAPGFADPQVGPLYGGIYQYVKFASPLPTPSVRGAICYWSDESNYIVTTGYNATTAYKVAGVIINATSPGNWDFIQIAGIAMTLFGATVTVGTGAAAGTTSPSTAIAAATVSTSFLGTVVLQNGANGVVSPCELNILAGLNY